MAKTLCRVAGGGKPLKGNAEAGDVLAGKTFSNKQSNALTGTMPNQGGHQSSTGVGGGSGSLYAYMPYGYYGNYKNSGNAWIDITDDQAKTLANNAGVGYNKGVSDADGRVNTSSASYNSGYAKGYSNGYNAGGAVGHSANLRVAVQHTGSGDVKCWVYLNGGQIGVWHQNANGVTKDAFNSTITI